MKHFRFFCGTNPDYTLSADFNDTMREASSYCGYLSRMYEFYFPPTRTGGASSLNVLLLGSPLSGELTLLQGDAYNVISWADYNALSNEEKPLFLMELLQQAIMEQVSKQSWNPEPFTHTFEKIKSSKGLFREHWKKPVLSPDKLHKAQVYFEDDYERNGTYVDFTDKKNNLIKRVQFTPRGYSVYCQDVGAIRWIDSSTVKIFYIQTPRAGADYEGNTRDYWTIGIDGTVEFYYKPVEQGELNPHGLFNLGVMYWGGKVIMQDKEKGLQLIKQAAELKYKHAVKWLESNTK